MFSRIAFVFILITSSSFLFAQKEDPKEEWIGEFLFIETKEGDSIPYTLSVQKNFDATLSYKEKMGEYILDGFVQLDSTNKLNFFLYEDIEGFDSNDSLPLMALLNNGEVIVTYWGSFRPQFFEPIDSMVYFKRKFDVIDHYTQYIDQYVFESEILSEPWLEHSLRVTMKQDYLSYFSFLTARESIYEADSLILFEGICVDKSGVGSSGMIIVGIDRFLSDLIVAYFDDYGQPKIKSKMGNRATPLYIKDWIDENMPSE